MTRADLPGSLASGARLCSAGVSARILLCDRRTFDLSSTAFGNSMSGVIAPALPCEGYANATLLVRVHQLELSAGAEVTVVASHVSVCDADPRLEFIAQPAAAEVALTSGNEAPALFLEPLAGPLGTHVAVAVRGERSVVDPVTMVVTLTIELLLRNVPPQPSLALPDGTTNDATLRWDGTRWVESTGVRADASGNLSADGAITAATALVADAVTYTGTDGEAGQVLTTDGSGNATFEDPAGTVSGTGTDNRVVRWNGTTNIQNSGVTIDDSNNVSGVTSLSASSVLINTHTAAKLIEALQVSTLRI